MTHNFKQKKLVSCHNYSRAVNPEYTWDFGDQRVFKTVTKFPKRPQSDFYKLITYNLKSDWGRHSFYPGQKIWIIRIDNRTGQYSVDWDHIQEVYAFGEVGSSALFHYWLRSYGVGHGIDASDLYLTKTSAVNNIRGVLPYRYPS